MDPTGFSNSARARVPSEEGGVGSNSERSETGG